MTVQEAVGTHWHFISGDRPKFLHRILLVVSLSYPLQLPRSGPQPGKFWSSKGEVVIPAEGEAVAWPLFLSLQKENYET